MNWSNEPKHPKGTFYWCNHQDYILLLKHPKECNILKQASGIFVDKTPPKGAFYYHNTVMYAFYWWQTCKECNLLKYFWGLLLWPESPKGYILLQSPSGGLYYAAETSRTVFYWNTIEGYISWLTDFQGESRQ